VISGFGMSVETERPAKHNGRVRKPSRYVREALEGTIEGGTTRSKFRLIPKGIRLPTGTAATVSRNVNLVLACYLRGVCSNTYVARKAVQGDRIPCL
jgi:hypothetical protein